MMDNYDIIKSKLERIIKNCNNAILVNETSVDDPDKGYPYASGYSRSALQSVVDDVESILKNYLIN